MPPGRPPSMPPSGPGRHRSRSTPKSTATRSPCTCATAVGGSNRTRYRAIARASPCRSGHAWPGSGARRSSVPLRGAGPRSRCRCPGPSRCVEREGPVSGQARPRVFLVDDHAMFRAGVRAELGDAVDVIAVIRAGARGYVTKTISGDELLQAIRRVEAGDAVFSPRLAGFVLDAFAGSAGEAALTAGLDPELDLLSPREREVLRLIARGYTYKEVARELIISVKTVESHVSSVLRKLQLSTRHELTRWATARRLV